MRVLSCIILFFFIYFILCIFVFNVVLCKLLYLLGSLPQCTFSTMSIIYLFVSVLLLYVTYVCWEIAQ